MDIESVLSFMQQFRAQLEVWGVTTEFLVAIALIASAVFIVSLREVAGWFLKVNGLREEIQKLSKQNEELQLSLDLIRDSLLRMESSAAKEEVTAATPPAAATSEEAPQAKRFPLDH